jgi:hypothetical protein
MGLRQLQLKWFDKFDEMSEIVSEDCLAAPFVSVPDKSVGPVRCGSILLVGKATDKCWRKDAFLQSRGRPPEKRLEERQDASKAHLAEMLTKPNSSFWYFWNQLRDELKVPVIWTNLAKLGVMEGNPAGKRLMLQKDLAKDTLKAEIEEYKPSMVFLVSGTYAEKPIVFPVFGPSDQWEKPGDYWWQQRTEEMPPVLWTYHPQGRHGRKEQRAEWIGQARRLLG